MGLSDLQRCSSNQRESDKRNLGKTYQICTYGLGMALIEPDLAEEMRGKEEKMEFQLIV